MLTSKQKKRLAKEAERLAGEIVEGMAPPFNPQYYCDCALGVVARRARIPGAKRDPGVEFEIERVAFGGIDASDPRALVSRGLRHSNPDGAVFPLLAFADAMEESARK